MTAINIFQQSDAVHMVTDGLSNCHTLLSKTHVFPNMSCALSVTGGERSFSLLGMLAYESSFLYDRPEYLIANLVTLVRDCQEKYPDKTPHPLDDTAADHFDVVVAAYLDKPCEIQGLQLKPGPIVGVVASSQTEQHPPYTLMLHPQQRHYFFHPGLPAIYQEFVAHIRPSDIDQIDVADAAVAVIEIQRRHINPQFPNVIGGHALLTTITKTEITSRVLKRWRQHLTEAGYWDLENENL